LEKATLCDEDRERTMAQTTTFDLMVIGGGLAGVAGTAVPPGKKILIAAGSSPLGQRFSRGQSGHL
jgi:hypothetical protein